MSHTTKYDLGESEASDVQAIEDIRFWLGEERFAKIDEMFRGYSYISVDAFTFHCAFMGIQGRPALAWHRRLWPAKRQAPAVSRYTAHSLPPIWTVNQITDADASAEHVFVFIRGIEAIHFAASGCIDAPL